MSNHNSTVLTEKDKKLLEKIEELDKLPYPPIPSDLAPPNKWYAVMYRLYKLEALYYITLHRKRGRIRRIELLATA